MTKVNEMLIVFGGGALGGLISVVDAWADPISYPVTFIKILSLVVIPFLKGGIAAGIGVYLLTTLDPNHISKAFFFSVACGLAFPSILSKSGTLAENVTSQVAQHFIDDSVARIESIASSAAANQDLPVTELKNVSDQILVAQQKIPGTEGNKSVEAALQQALGALGTRATEGDTKAVDAISDIGFSSAAQGLRAPTDKAIQELRSIQASPNLDQTSQDRVKLTIKMLEKRL
jgi:hypothetical protein